MCSNRKAYNRKHLTRRLAKEVVRLDDAARMVQRTVSKLEQHMPREEAFLASGLELSMVALFNHLRNLKMAALLIGR